MAFGANGDGGMGDFGSGLNSNQGFRPLSNSPIFGGGSGGGGGGFGGALGDYFGKMTDFQNQSKLNEAGYANQRNLANLNNAAQFAGQQLQSQTARYATDQNNATQRYGIGTQAQTDTYRAQIADATNRYLGDQQTGLGYFNTNTQAATNKYNTDLANATNLHGIDTQAQTARRGQDVQLQEANIQADAAKLPYQIKQQQYNQLLPQFQAFAAQGYQPGSGQVGTQPAINAGPIWNDAQVQQQVNNQRAVIDATTAGNIQNMQASVAGRGFGGNSPLAQALAANYQGQGLGAAANAEQQTRWNAAQGNAQQVLQGQQAQESQFANRQQEDIARRNAWLGQYQSLAGLLGANA